MKKEPASACCSRICMLAVQDGTQDLPQNARPARFELCREIRGAFYTTPKECQSLHSFWLSILTLSTRRTSSPTRLRLFNPTILRFMAFVDRTHSTCRNLGQAIGGPEP